jgi:uncharacterized membrane-anchored protein YhcB (DUF1043 family)
MNEQAINLLLQIPLAGVVVFVVVVFLKYLKEMTTQMIEFMAQQAETNRQFLATQREQMNQAIGRMAEELKMMREDFAEERGFRQKRNRNV